MDVELGASDIVVNTNQPILNEGRCLFDQFQANDKTV